MIARNVTMRLKAHSVAEFSRILETEVLPLLRKQEGSKTRSALSARAVAKSSASVSGIRRIMPKAIVMEVFQRR